MNVDMIFKIAGIGILVAVLVKLFETSEREEYATIATLAGVVIVLMMVLNMISKLFDSVKTIFQLY